MSHKSQFPNIINGIENDEKGHNIVNDIMNDMVNDKKSQNTVNDIINKIMNYIVNDTKG